MATMQKQRTRGTTQAPALAVDQGLSTAIVQDFLEIAIASILYERALLDDDHFDTEIMAVPPPGNNSQMSTLSVKRIKDGHSEEGSHLLRALNTGVQGAISKGFLQNLMLLVLLDPTRPDEIIETAIFTFWYNDGGVRVSMAMSKEQERERSQTLGESMNVDEVKRALKKAFRYIVASARNLDDLPPQRHVDIKLVYNDRAPSNYEPENFRKSTGHSLTLCTDSVSMAPLIKLAGAVQTGHHGINFHLISACNTLPTDVILGATPADPRAGVAWDAEAIIHDTGRTFSARVAQSQLEVPLGRQTAEGSIFAIAEDETLNLSSQGVLGGHGERDDKNGSRRGRGIQQTLPDWSQVMMSQLPQVEPETLDMANLVLDPRANTASALPKMKSKMATITARKTSIKHCKENQLVKPQSPTTTHQGLPKKGSDVKAQTKINSKTEIKARPKAKSPPKLKPGSDARKLTRDKSSAVAMPLGGEVQSKGKTKAHRKTATARVNERAGPAAKPKATASAASRKAGKKGNTTAAAARPSALRNPAKPTIELVQWMDCYCGGKEQDEALQCDRCARWLHQACAGFRNHADIPEHFTCIECQLGEGCKAIAGNLNALALFRRVLSLGVSKVVLSNKNTDLQQRLGCEGGYENTLLHRLRTEGFVEPGSNGDTPQWIAGLEGTEKFKMYFQPGSQLEREQLGLPETSEPYQALAVSGDSDLEDLDSHGGSPQAIHAAKRSRDCESADDVDDEPELERPHKKVKSSRLGRILDFGLMQSQLGP